MNRILIVGANFNNKGAQSMLFNTVSAIKKIDSDSEIYFATTEIYQEDDYTFKRIYYSDDARKIAIASNDYFTIVKRGIKDFIKMVIGRRNNLWEFMNLKDIMPQINLVIDISGFSLGDKWPTSSNERYLDGIRLAKKYGVPMILMPQSFGPFNYDEAREFLLKEEQELLPDPDIIFAREQEGYDLLKENFELNNIQHSTDLVLQSGQIDLDLIFKTPVVINTPNVKQNAVGIVPNKQCFTRGNKELILQYYKIIIDKLLLCQKEIYIFRHSKEDLEPCQWIYNQFQDSERVHLVENDFSCIEYDDFVRKFQFIVCSRYHGIVHAYKNDVPCIILGWAVKYKELAKQVSQSQFIFNITDGTLDKSSLKEAVSNMLQNYQAESSVIHEKVTEIQKDNCFSCLKQYI